MHSNPTLAELAVILLDGDLTAEAVEKTPAMLPHELIRWWSATLDALTAIMQKQIQVWRVFHVFWEKLLNNKPVTDL